MPVRVRTRIKSLKGLKVGEVIETNPLLNTGYAGSSPEIIVPFKYMKEKARGSLHRNILIHCYWTVDDRKVHESARKEFNYIKKFLEEIVKKYG